ncbi:MAG TPA: SpoIID/LytB domain-containing protein [Candidatus Woesebacteria bacterium]|nr:SpoIID/LytB domain-containing protein [Candidatus Woesebacteria bacterium]
MKFWIKVLGAVVLTVTLSLSKGDRTQYDMIGVIQSVGRRVTTFPYFDFAQYDNVFATFEEDELQVQIDELEKLKKMSEAATTPLEKEVRNLEQRIDGARAGIARAKQEAVQVAANIKEREQDLAVQYKLLSKRIHNQYKYLRLMDESVALLAELTQPKLTKEMVYQASVRAQDEYFLTSIGQDIVQLNQDKSELEKRQIVLAGLEKQLDEQADFFKGEIAKAKEYQRELSGKIAALSAQQQAVINARSGSAITSVGEVPISGDIYSTIAGFRQNAPTNSFAVFTFGAFTHRNGMSQYGAKARAEDGQDYKKILKAYYGKEPEQKDTGGNIRVESYGEMEFETKYLYGIAEMPDTWPKEALKAQAVAARTFAYMNYKKENKEICTNESCQAFRKSKSDNPPDAWKQAVDETKGMILDGISTQYSAISGGYLNTLGWDTTDGSGGGDWTTRAWEVKANAPWFYKSWYRQVLPGSYSDKNSDCGRKPWLTQEEMSDILNAYIVMRNPNGAETGRILPITINQCPVGKNQSESPYSMSELRSFVDNPVKAISQVRVKNNNSGQTTSVAFETNRGEITMSGNEYKEIFNMRAPGYLAIHQSSFAFFNIEQKN